MNKYAKLLVVSGMVVAMAFAAGCGDEKKPEPAKKPATTTTAQKPAAKPAAPAAKLPEAANWRYPSYIKTQEDTPKMTPEIQKIVDECYAQMKLHASEKGKLLNDSAISKGDQRKVRDLHFHARGEKHDNKNKFKNTKGKEVYAQEIFHIYITVDKDTSAVKNWKFAKYVVSPEIPDGKLITIKEVK